MCNFGEHYLKMIFSIAFGTTVFTWRARQSVLYRLRMELLKFTWRFLLLLKAGSYRAKRWRCGYIARFCSNCVWLNHFQLQILIKCRQLSSIFVYCSLIKLFNWENRLIALLISFLLIKRKRLIKLRLKQWFKPAPSSSWCEWISCSGSLALWAMRHIWGYRPILNFDEIL